MNKKLADKMSKSPGEKQPLPEGRRRGRERRRGEKKGEGNATCSTEKVRLASEKLVRGTRKAGLDSVV